MNSSSLCTSATTAAFWASIQPMYSRSGGGQGNLRQGSVGGTSCPPVCGERRTHFCGDQRQSQRLIQQPKNSCRASVWRSDGNQTVVRSGFGIFYGFLGERRSDVIQSGFSQNTNVVPTTDNINFIGTLPTRSPTALRRRSEQRQATRRFSDGRFRFSTRILSPRGFSVGNWAFGTRSRPESCLTSTTPATRRSTLTSTPRAIPTWSA